jgi:hypothetical protein
MFDKLMTQNTRGDWQDCVRLDAREKCARGNGNEPVYSSRSEELKMDEQSTRVTRWGALHFFAISDRGLAQ